MKWYGGWSNYGDLEVPLISPRLVKSDGEGRHAAMLAFSTYRVASLIVKRRCRQSRSGEMRYWVDHQVLREDRKCMIQKQRHKHPGRGDDWRGGRSDTVVHLATVQLSKRPTSRTHYVDAPQITVVISLWL